MPKYRKLWVKTLESEDLDDMPDDFTRLLWTLLPLVASREGTIPDHAVQITRSVFPRREDVQPGQIFSDYCVEMLMLEWGSTSVEQPAQLALGL